MARATSAKIAAARAAAAEAERNATVYTTVQSAAIEVVNKIVNHVQQRVSDPSDWYAGITDDPERRLFAEHFVRKEDIGSYIFFPVADKKTPDFIRTHLPDSNFGRIDGGPHAHPNILFLHH